MKISLDTDPVKHDCDFSNKHLSIINKDNLYLRLKVFQRSLISSYCKTSFFRCCPVNPTFLVLEWPNYNEFSIPGSQTSQITRN